MPTLTIENLSKTFPGTVALRDVSVTCEAGEVHALLGMNGSGKSTVVKILAGFHEPDTNGRITVDGNKLEFGNPEASRALGFRFVHQDLALMPTLDTVENLAIERGWDSGPAGPIMWRRERESAAEVMRSLGYGHDVRRPVGGLSASEKTGVAIARAFTSRAGVPRVIVLDEPTAAMPAFEVDRFFERVRAMRERGVAIVYISHHLSEIFRLADTVSVLRDGRLVGTSRVAELNHDELVDMIVGARLAAGPKRRPASAARASAPVLEVDGLSGSSVSALDLTVAPGEVIGIAGVDGSGREHVCRLIFGSFPRGGTVVVEGEELPASRPDLALRRRIGLVPGDRRGFGLFPQLSVLENLTVGDTSSFFRGGFLRRGPERREGQSWIERLQVKTSSMDAPIALLSGGNQQKVMFARTLRRRPRVLLLDEPTQGVDVSAKADIYELIAEAADSGSGVVVASADSEELAWIATRVIVLAGGRVVGELRDDDVTEDGIDRLALGAYETDDPVWEREEVHG